MKYITVYNDHMTEPVSEISSHKEEQKHLLEKYITLAEELSNRTESFPFSGANSESYIKLKADDEEYPGFTTPIDEIIARMEIEGIRVTLGTHPESGNVFILPMLSEDKDIENDSLFPRHLEITEDMDETLKELITTNLNIFQSSNSKNIQ